MDKKKTGSTKNSREIHASPDRIYQAFTTPEALIVWQAPGDMTARMHHFDLKPGGGYEMSLYYPENEQTFNGKTNTREDRFAARFVELIPDQKIVQAIRFDSPDPAFAGEMIMEILLEEINSGLTKVTILFKDIPSGIKPEDNEQGTASSLEKLARYVEQKK